MTAFFFSDGMSLNILSFIHIKINAMHNWQMHKSLCYPGMCFSSDFGHVNGPVM